MRKARIRDPKRMPKNETAGKKRPVLMLDRARPMLVNVTTSMTATTRPPKKNGRVSKR